jgi:hypothetical protein
MRHRKTVRGSATFLAALVGLTALVNVGCGGGKGEVSGEVTYNGKPIPWGRITFVSQVGNRKAISSSIRNGAYQIKDCPAGPVKISVESFKAVARNAKVRPQGMAKGFKPPESEEPPPEAVGKHLAIPLKYGNSDSSGLEYTVRSGSQSHNIPLTP